MMVRKELWFGFGLMAIIARRRGLHAAVRAGDHAAGTSAC